MFERRLRCVSQQDMVCKKNLGKRFTYAMMQCVQAYNVLGNVMSLVGGFASMSCSLLMPSLFYLILFWKELAKGSRTGKLNIYAEAAPLPKSRGVRQSIIQSSRH